ncbi:hypothetical protein TYRP_009961 [Tyrophagus putrescentiae]|nr:hypothetical protein TYRP_009961 [Tyrophagus putrescentiae]
MEKRKAANRIILLTGTGNAGSRKNKRPKPLYSAQFYLSNDTKFGDEFLLLLLLRFFFPYP